MTWSVRQQMKLKEKILHLLKEKQSEYISGEEMALSFNVSRNAIWKAINSLREEGYKISAVSNKGYILDNNNIGIFNGDEIRSYLKSGYKIEYLKEVTSTNDVAMDYGKNGFSEDIIIVADYQKAGRGRKGREFYSPKNSGAYFSLLLHPDIYISNALYITAAAASAVTGAFKELYNIDTQIKWVNDIYYNNKKICGILTEAHFDMESGVIDYAALGIGINIFEPEEGFHENIKNIAGATFKRDKFNNNIRCQLVAKVIDTFSSYYQDLSNKSFLEEYKNRSLLIGKNITIEKNGINKKANVKGIDDNCRLQVVYENGQTETLQSGEISLVCEQQQW